jgi:hypothetical protein
LDDLWLEEVFMLDIFNKMRGPKFKKLRKPFKKQQFVLASARSGFLLLLHGLMLFSRIQ